MPIKNRFFWVPAIIGVILDRFTKYLIVQNFTLTETFPLLPGVFHFTYVTNTGAAFSLFQGGVWLLWLSLLVSLGLIALAILSPSLKRFEQLGYGFVLGGAMGNGIDRFATGYVVDFIDFRVINFPIFNLADIFINVGIICLLISTFLYTSSGENGE